MDFSQLLKSILSIRPFIKMAASRDLSPLHHGVTLILLK
jgi:hypothetical protein